MNILLKLILLGNFAFLTEMSTAQTHINVFSDNNLCIPRTTKEDVFMNGTLQDLSDINHWEYTTQPNPLAFFYGMPYKELCPFLLGYESKDTVIARGHVYHRDVLSVYYDSTERIRELSHYYKPRGLYHHKEFVRFDYQNHHLIQITGFLEYSIHPSFRARTREAFEPDSSKFFTIDIEQHYNGELLKVI